MLSIYCTSPCQYTVSIEMPMHKNKLTVSYDLIIVVTTVRAWLQKDSSTVLCDRHAYPQGPYNYTLE